MAAKIVRPPVTTKRIVLALMVGFVFVALLRVTVVRLAGSRFFQRLPEKRVPEFVICSEAELVAKLKECRLWEFSGEEDIPLVAFKNFPPEPADLDNPASQNIDFRKKLFLHTIFPAALIVQQEVKKERARLEAIVQKLDPADGDLVFEGEELAWQRKLGLREVTVVNELVQKYRTPQLRELLLRIHPVPVSLIMAQGALETGWGGSRFVRQANNLFGVYTWGEEGLVPERREDGKNHKVAVYDSLLDSIRHYTLMLNRLPAYAEFRALRQETSDPVSLADGLRYYSERRDDYLVELRKVILGNDLFRYDGYELLDTPGH